MRSMQMPACPRRVRFNHAALLCAFNAHVRSVIEYGSIIWSGAAVTHLARFERLQHRFLMWLAANTRDRCPSLEYERKKNRASDLTREGLPAAKALLYSIALRDCNGMFIHVWTYVLARVRAQGHFVSCIYCVLF